MSRWPSWMLKSLQILKSTDHGKRKVLRKRSQAEQKEEKKAAAPAPEEKMDECDQALAAEPKAKDPFALLSKESSPLCWKI